MTGLLLALATVAATGFGDPQLLGRLPFDEVSGLAVGTTGVWVLEDSGNPSRVTRVDRTGRVLRGYDVAAEAVDREDLAAAPDAAGVPSLWLADTGDNRAEREQVQVHRVAEADPSGPVTTYAFTYEDGPHDAEALLVPPGGDRVVVVTKGLGGAGVYTARLGERVLREVAAVRLTATGTDGGPAGGFGQLLVTGGAVSADGRLVALRTYTDLYEWPLLPDLAATFAQEPVRSPLPPSEQGEAVAYERDGRAVLLASEGEDAPLQRLTRQGAPPTPVRTGVALSREAPPPVREQGRSWLPVAAGGAAAAVLLGAVVRRRGRGR